MSSKLEGCKQWIKSNNPTCERLESLVSSLETRLEDLTNELEQSDYIETIDFVNLVLASMREDGIEACKFISETVDGASASKNNSDYSLNTETDTSIVKLHGEKKLDAFAALKSQLGVSL